MSSAPRGESSYQVIRRIAAGGMAEVFHAEVVGLAGFHKHVAIKRVLPHLAQNATFSKMFLDEARLSARLSHRNIVQVFDIGRDDETYFIVMEYVDGVTLADLVDHVHARGNQLATAMAVHVGIEMCHALHYAHELTDDAGRPLGLVHRDVSPANVLVSRAGDVKLVDFGVAKASSQVEKTEPGIVKGKVAYLAPELTYGEEPSAKADQFAAGVVLWEVLAGQRLFRADDPIESVLRVRKGEIPPLAALNAAVPEELERVVRTALARDKRDRFESLEAMARALTELQFAHRLAVSPGDLGRLVREVIGVASGAAAPPAGAGMNSVLLSQDRISLTPPSPPSPVAPEPAAVVPPPLPVARPEGAAPERAGATATAAPRALRIESIVGLDVRDALARRLGSAGANPVEPLPLPPPLPRAARDTPPPPASASTPPAAQQPAARPAATRGKARRGADETSDHEIYRRIGLRRSRWPLLVVLLLAGGAAYVALRARMHTLLAHAVGRLAADRAGADAGTATAAASAPSSSAPALAPSPAAQSAARATLQRAADRCNGRVAGRPAARRIRVVVTYEGPTGRAAQVRVVPGSVPLRAAVAACIEQAARSQPLAPFRAARWAADFEIAVP